MRIRGQHAYTDRFNRKGKTMTDRRLFDVHYVSGGVNLTTLLYDEDEKGAEAQFRARYPQMEFTSAIRVPRYDEQSDRIHGMLTRIANIAETIREHADPEDFDITTERQIREIEERIEAVRFTLL